MLVYGGPLLLVSCGLADWAPCEEKVGLQFVSLT